MAGANSQMSLVGLDFDTIKNNLKTYLKSQDILKDYNFEGSGLSVLLDVLTYNTQYNAFYLNMVANEMFLDTALQRSSVVSHAKLMNYTPKSPSAPSAFIDVIVSNVNSGSLTLPAYTNFLSESVDGINYNFVSANTITVNANTTSNTVTFTNVELKQGIPANYSFTVDSSSNPNYIFEIPDNTIDTNTIVVTVQESSSNTYFDTYIRSSSFLKLDGESKVFFIQEALNGNYEILFGNGILGKKLKDGNIVRVSYITTQGSSAAGANNFILMDNISGFNTVTINGKIAAYQGSEKESIDSIKFQAPKSFAAQNRGVTKNDYITLVQQNSVGVEFDAVNVWGGEENDPPVYGQVFVCFKPTGAYTLTETQKQKLINDVIKPISVVTVEPKIVDPDYTFIKINTNVIYDPSKTNLLPSQIEQIVKTAISNFGTFTLNTFNSTFMASELTAEIKSSHPSIVTSELSIQLQKKFYPNLTTPTTYNFYFGTELDRGMFQSSISSYPSVQFQDPLNLDNIVNGVYIEEIPSSTGGVESISLLNTGFGYQYPPIVTILGDGQGATAEAVINTSGQIRRIDVTNSGNNYTSAIVSITPATYDTTGRNAAAIVNLEGRYGTLRSFYNNSQYVKTVFKNNVGTIDYLNGIITLDSFGPIEVDNPLGQLTISVKPKSTLLSSTYNRILTLDPFDPNAITVNIIAKTQ